MASRFEKEHPLAIGAEFEFIFVFREQLLGEGETVIVNGQNDAGHRLDRNIWASDWAIREAIDSKPPTFRYYRGEPQKIVMRLLEDVSEEDGGEDDMSLSDGSEGGRYVNYEPARETDDTQLSAYDAGRVDSGVPSEDGGEEADRALTGDDAFVTRLNWQIKRDLSLRQLTRKEKEDLFIPADEFDSDGVEMATPPSSATSAETGISLLFAHAANYFSRLKTNNSTAGVKIGCGLHIHVGCLDGSRLPPGAIRKIEFILLPFEHEISRIHKLHRIGLQAGPHIRSNLSQYLGDKLGHHEYQYAEDSETIVARSKYVGIERLRRIIFTDEDENNEDENNEDEDAEYATVKGKGSVKRRFAYNFQNVDGWNFKDGRMIQRPPTIEFRQHAGTFDLHRAKFWADFDVAIVRYGLYLDETTTTADEILPEVTSWDSRMLRFEILLEKLSEIGMPEDSKQALLSAARVTREEDDPHWALCDADGLPLQKSGMDAEDEEMHSDEMEDDMPEDEAELSPEEVKRTRGQARLGMAPLKAGSREHTSVTGQRLMLDCRTNSCTVIEMRSPLFCVHCNTSWTLLDSPVYEREVPIW